MTVELERRIDLLEKRSRRAVWISLLLGAFILFDFFIGMRGHERQYEDLSEHRSRSNHLQHKVVMLEYKVEELKYTVGRIERHVELPGLQPTNAYGENL